MDCIIAVQLFSDVDFLLRECDTLRDRLMAAQPISADPAKLRQQLSAHKVLLIFNALMLIDTKCVMQLRLESVFCKCTTKR